MVVVVPAVPWAMERRAAIIPAMAVQAAAEMAAVPLVNNRLWASLVQRAEIIRADQVAELRALDCRVTEEMAALEVGAAAALQAPEPEGRAERGANGTRPTVQGGAAALQDTVHPRFLHPATAATMAAAAAGAAVDRRARPRGMVHRASS